MRRSRLAIMPIAAALALVMTLASWPLTAGAVRADSGLAITGNLVGSAGNLGGIAISACTTDYSYCAQTQTDDAGAFALSDIPAGVYKLYIGYSATYLEGWYLGPGTVADFWPATEIPLATGSASLPDIQLTRASRITGLLVGAAGNEGSLQVSAASGNFGFSGTVDASGNFVVDRIAPGVYTLSVSDPNRVYVGGYLAATGFTQDPANALQLSVPEAGLALGSVQLLVGTSISGSVTGPIQAFNGIDAAAYGYPTGISSDTYVDSDGNYRIGGLLPGDYSLYFNDVTSVYFGGYYAQPAAVADAPGTVVTVGPDGLTLPPVQLEPIYQIQGSAVGDPSHPEAVNITACPVTTGTCAYGYVYPSSGSFNVFGLHAGDYTLRFDDPGGYYPSGYYSGYGLVAAASDATVIHVPPSASGIELSLTTPSLPGSPRNFVATPDDGSVHLSWDAPAFDGGSAITQYEVMSSSGLGCVTTATSCTITSLTNGETYAFWVTARNAIGAGPSVLDFAVPEVPPASSASALVLTAQVTSQTAGMPNSLTLTAKDQDGKAVSGYVGTVHFSSSDPRAQLPADYTFTAADAGTHTFSFRLDTAGSQTVTVQDGSIQGQATVAVAPASAAQLVLTGPATATAGASQKFNVMAVDAYGNVATSYSGTVKLRVSDRRGDVVPATLKLTKGIGTFKATFKTAGAQSITVKDKAGAILGGSLAVAVAAGKAASLDIATKSRTATAGAPVVVTVTARDRFGNVAPDYLGKIHFSSTDKKAILPADYTFTASDAGVHNFTVTLSSAGNRLISARDVAKHSIGGVTNVKVVTKRP